MLKHQLLLSENKTDKNIVLLHGFGGNHRVWKHQIPILLKKFNVLTIDLPSHGENNEKLSNMKATIDNVTKEILKILDSLKMKKSIFMGVSLGTIFIKYIEMKYSEYIDSAILVGAVGKLNKLLGVTAKIFSKIGDKLPFKWIYSIFSKIMMPLKSSKTSRKIFCRCALELNAKEFKSWMNIMVESITMNIKFKTQEHLQNFYISGHSDVCFLKEIKREVVSTKAKFLELQQCGHICNIDQKEKFNDIIMNFLEQKYCTT